MNCLLEQLDVPRKIATFRAEKVTGDDIGRNANLQCDVAFGGRDGLIVGEIIRAEIDNRDNTALIKAQIRDQGIYERLATGVTPTLVITEGGTKAYLTDYVSDTAIVARTFKVFDEAHPTGLAKRFLSSAEKQRWQLFGERSPNVRLAKCQPQARVAPGTTRLNPNLIKIMKGDLER
jgi:hypothetical protein